MYGLDKVQQSMSGFSRELSFACGSGPSANKKKVVITLVKIIYHFYDRTYANQITEQTGTEVRLRALRTDTIAMTNARRVLVR